MEKIDEIIKSAMENYPEASSGSCLKCRGWNYDKMEFTFVNEETGQNNSINLENLKKGFKVLLKIVEDGKYLNSVGQVPNFLAINYDWDAQDYDALVQATIFGEVIYG